MTVIEIKQYGTVLTGREFGKNVTRALLEKNKQHPRPFALDFTGVLSMGSSFGDELVPAIAREQSNSIKALNANRIVKECLTAIGTDANVEIVFEK